MYVYTYVCMYVYTYIIIIVIIIIIIIINDINKIESRKEKVEAVEGSPHQVFVEKVKIFWGEASTASTFYTLASTASTCYTISY